MSICGVGGVSLQSSSPKASAPGSKLKQCHQESSVREWDFSNEVSGCCMAVPSPELCGDGAALTGSLTPAGLGSGCPSLWLRHCLSQSCSSLLQNEKPHSKNKHKKPATADKTTPRINMSSKCSKMADFSNADIQNLMEMLGPSP